MMDTMKEEQFRTVSQLAKELGISESLIKKMFRRGKLKGEKRGRDWLVTKGRKFFTAKEYAKEKNYSHSHMQWLLRKGRVKGVEAVKVGRDWIITEVEPEVRSIQAVKGEAVKGMAQTWQLLEYEERQKNKKAEKKAQE
jgi:hypothetical protein